MRKNVILFCTLLILAIFLSGCMTSSTQKSPPNIGTTPMITSTISEPANSGIQNRYVVGDIIGRTPNDYAEAKIVYGSNSQTNEYQIDSIFMDVDNRWGYRMYPNPEIKNRDLVESSYPHLIDHIEISKVVTKYPDADSMNAALHPTTAPTPTYQESSYSVSDSGSPSKQCWVNGYYRKSGVYVQGYYRRC